MLNKIVQKKNLILIIYSAVLLALLLVTLVFGNSEDKLRILIISLIIPFIIYGFARLMFKVVSINASVKTTSFFCYFFLVGGFIGTIIALTNFIGEFPNGLSPALGACGGLIISALDFAKKNMNIEDK